MIGALTVTLLLLGRQGISDRGSQIADLSLSSQLSALSPQLLALAPNPSAIQGPQPVAKELVVKKGEWIQKPVTLKSLRGKVVLVDFWAYTCINCIRTFPYVNEWYKRYHNLGFEVVAIHRPEFDFEADPKNVAGAAKRFGFSFPVLNDVEGANWDNYQVDAWPTKILVDPKGNIVYKHVGEGHYDEFERQIQSQLAMINPGVRFGTTMTPVRPTDAPGAVCRPCTLETFLANPAVSHYTRDQRGKKVTFTYPQKTNNGVFLSGVWTPMRMYMQEEKDASFILNYMAKDVNSVLRTSGKPVSFVIYQDGKPLPADSLGQDAKMVAGQPTVTITEPRMYSVIRNPHWGYHALEFRFKEPGARVYSFTFGSECRTFTRKK